MSETETVILSQLGGGWCSLDDLMNAVRMRKRVGYFGVLTALARLREKGVIERKGKKGSYEFRRSQEPAP
jgi:predicted transcriptional regulator